MPSGIPLYEDYGDIEQWVKACTSHPEFRVLPSTGSISMSQVNTELGRPAAATISLQSAGVRNLTVSSRAYNTPISMGELRGGVALLNPIRALVNIDPLEKVEPSIGSTWSYNYRTGMFTYVKNSIPNTVVVLGEAVGEALTSGAYNWEGLIITGASIGMVTNSSGVPSYNLPCTQYPSFLNDWTGLFTFVPDAYASFFKPSVYGGLKIG